MIDVLLVEDKESLRNALTQTLRAHGLSVEASADTYEAKRALAHAMAEDKVYSPRVATAVESVHQRMGDMKRASIRHVFDMRTVLSPEQGDKLLTLAQRALEQSH